MTVNIQLSFLLTLLHYGYSLAVFFNEICFYDY